MVAASPRRFSVRREIQSRHFYGFQFASSRATRVDVYLTCGHVRTYPVSRSPKIGSRIACDKCAPKEVR